MLGACAAARLEGGPALLRGDTRQGRDGAKLQGGTEGARDIDSVG